MILVLVQKIRSAYNLPFREKFWFLFLYPYSGLIRAMILLIPFRKIAMYLGKYHHNYQLSCLASDKQLGIARRIGHVIKLVARYTPWDSKCFVQVIMARTLLGWYQIPYVIHFGARLTRQKKKPMTAHTWIKVGPWIITGRQGHQSYGVVGSYLAHSISTDVSVSQQI
ncbi:lasso peptide biosynthesis B2 protein [Aliikangiella sp. M105]|uniref:Lasso peptide biosynthesis B2 protein n=1 Tax=Aliikangiella coralliicola TaxID=2592383 RepID=A0A545U787_9GAMM|nr:lasso peptide biosynthesis B2 protein [Aliikangiella coralliicola]